MSAYLYDNKTIIIDGVKLSIFEYITNHTLKELCPVCGKDGCGKVKLRNALTEEILVKNICIRISSSIHLNNGWNAYIHDIDNSDVTRIINFTAPKQKIQDKDNKVANRLLETFSSNFKSFPDEMYFKVLEKEGITQEMIQAHKLIYVPIQSRASIMRQLGNANDYIGIAGFNTKEGDKGELYYTFSGSSGIWFNVYDEDFNIVNFNIWVDNGIKEKILKLKGIDLSYEIEKTNKGHSKLDSNLQREFKSVWESKKKGVAKYNPLSSSNKDNGCKPNQLASLYRPFINQSYNDEIMIGTEGARKGLLLSEKKGVLVNAVFGVNNFKHQVKLLENKLIKAREGKCDKFGNPHKLITHYISAYDSDKMFNSMVLNAEIRKLKAIKKLGLKIYTMLWNPYLEGQNTKGIDDLYNKGLDSQIKHYDLTNCIDSLNARQIVFQNISLVMNKLKEKGYQVKFSNGVFTVYKKIFDNMFFVTKYPSESLSVREAFMYIDNEKLEDAFHLSHYKSELNVEIEDIISNLKVSNKKVYFLQS